MFHSISGLFLMEYKLTQTHFAYTNTMAQRVRVCVKVTEKLIFKDYNLHLIRFMSLLNVLAMNESLISHAEAFVTIFRSTEN